MCVSSYSLFPCPVLSPQVCLSCQRSWGFCAGEMIGEMNLEFHQMSDLAGAHVHWKTVSSCKGIAESRTTVQSSKGNTEDLTKKFLGKNDLCGAGFTGFKFGRAT